MKFACSNLFEKKIPSLIFITSTCYFKTDRYNKKNDKFYWKKITSTLNDEN